MRLYIAMRLDVGLHKFHAFMCEKYSDIFDPEPNLLIVGQHSHGKHR